MDPLRTELAAERACPLPDRSVALDPNSSLERFAGLGAVAIGRNEGERLRRCLTSLPEGLPAVYVDSGSTDDSVAFARSRGVEVVDLDMAQPFTAARARNEGFRALVARHPDLAYVLFLDGDCELMIEWLGAAIEVLRTRPEIGAVCGYRRERFPNATVFNTLCDVEWRGGATGETRAFGGDVLLRTEVVHRIGGYNPEIIAGEDEEIGIRVRAAGYRIWRIAQTSTLHDAAMTHPRQWWTRAKRCGHAFAHVHRLHGAPPEAYFRAELRRAALWGLAFPAVATVLAPATLGASVVALLGAYPLQAARIAHHTRRRGFTWRESLLWGASCALSKIPEGVGIVKYHRDRLLHRRPMIIEYKGPSAGSAERDGKTWRARRASAQSTA